MYQYKKNANLTSVILVLKLKFLNQIIINTINNSLNMFMVVDIKFYFLIF